MKKFIITLLSILIFTPNVFAEGTFAEHYNLAEQYRKQCRYTNAIGEYQKAMRINNLDNSARIGLINSHLDRATYYINTLKDYEKAANDYRAALFYLEVYATSQTMQISSQVTADVKTNLEKCFEETKFDKSAYSRYKKADEIRNNGLNDYAAAAYEFYRASLIGDTNIIKNANRNIADIIKSRTGNFRRAGDFYSYALKVAQDDSGLHNSYAQMLMKTNQEDLAINEFNKALETSINPKYILINLEKLYSKKMQDNPNSLNAILNLANVLHKQGKEKEALTYYKKAESMSPNNEIVIRSFGNYYLDIDNTNRAIEYFNKALKINPNSADTYSLLGNLYLKSKNKIKATEAYQQALKLDGNNINAQRGLITLNADLVTPAELLKLISYGNQTPTQSALTTLYNYAKELHATDNAAKALTYYDEVLKYDSNPEIYINIALAHAQNKNDAEAVNTLIAARQKFPGNQQVQQRLKEISKDVNNQKYIQASNYFNNNEYQQALDIYLEIKPESAETTLAIAACYKSLNNINQALEYYKKALEYTPKNSDIAYYIGVLYTELENWTSAKIYLQDAIKYNSKNEKAKELLASVIEQNNITLINKVIEKYNNNQHEEALKIISQVLTEDPNNAYAHYYRGLIYDTQKNYDLAIEEYKKSFVNNPTLVVANYLIAIIYDTKNEYPQALTYYKKFVKENKTDDEYKAYALSRIIDLKAYENQ